MSDNIIEATDEIFRESISKGIVVVDFSAEWCGPCKALVPILEELASNNEDVTFLKADIEKCSNASLRFGVRSVPTLMFCKDGAETNRLIGVQNIVDLQSAIDAIRESNGG